MVKPEEDKLAEVKMAAMVGATVMGGAVMAHDVYNMASAVKDEFLMPINEPAIVRSINDTPKPAERLMRTKGADAKPALPNVVPQIQEP